MPIGFGLACTHTPNIFIPPEDWEKRYKQAIGNVPQPEAAAKETLEVRKAYAARIEAAFDVLQRKLAEYQPDAVIMVTDDHNGMYDERLRPTFSMFVGEKGTGILMLGTFNEKPGVSPRVTVPCDRELAEYIAKGLVERNFDITLTRGSETHSLGEIDRGMGHGFTRTAPKLMPKLDVPTVLMWVNCLFDPAPSARRCLDLGRALADICKKLDRRIAIFGSGGLSHDPRGPRAGWIDEPLDRSVLKAFEDGEPDRLSTLFTFESDTFHLGTGEIRNWLVVGGAMGECKATTVDYLPIHHAITGVGFSYWQPVPVREIESARSGAAARAA